MDIKVNHNSQFSNHQHLLSSLIASSEESILCTGWLKLTGIKALAPAIKQAIDKNAKISILSNWIHTQKRASNLIAKWPEVTHHMAGENNRTLHSKIYYFQTGNSYTAIVGSANITEGGLTTSEELSLSINGKIGDDEHKKIRGYLDELQSDLQT